MIERLVRSVDFERVLRGRSQRQSTHFALHHAKQTPASPSPDTRNAIAATKLSTSDALAPKFIVEELPARSVDLSAERLWLGAVVPKRHARRAVTRSLLKRQIRAAMQRHADTLGAGVWIVRLRAPFNRGEFASAASDALKRAVRTELDAMLGYANPRVAVA